LLTKYKKTIYPEPVNVCPEVWQGVKIISYEGITMKRLIMIISCAAVMFFVSNHNSFAASIASGVFTGWDADPFTAVSISSDVATLQIQPYSDNVPTIYLTKHFTGVTALRFGVNFINESFRDVPPSDQGYLPNYLQVSFLPDSGVQTDFLGYDKNGVYDPTTLNTIGPYGSWFTMNITNFGRIDGTLFFILQDMGDAYSSQGHVRDVSVTESQANSVPEPSTMILLGGGLGALLLFRSRRKEMGTW
jgi:hypothetical protein